MALDVAMGGSTNTVLHILAAAQEGEVDFDAGRHRRDLAAGCRAWRRSSPNSDYHMEDVHRAGGIPAILGELRPRRAAQRRTCTPCTRPSLDGVARRRGTSAAAAPSGEAVELFHAAPGGVRTTEPFSTTNRWSTLDTDAADGCIRDVEHAYTADGGLAVLRGNLAPRRRGDQDRRASTRSCGTSQGPARVVESPGGGRRRRSSTKQIAARRRASWSATRARAAARACRRCCTRPRSSRARGLGQACALITDGRFSGGTSAASPSGHVSPEAAAAA